MTVLARLTLADLKERSRSRGVVPAVSLVLYLGYLSVPDRGAGYATVVLGGWRGTYGSAWMGACTALLSAIMVPVVGFFLVRPAAARDVRLGSAPLLVASPTPRLEIAAAKFVSDVLTLVAFGSLLVLAAVAMQLVRGENVSVDASDYLLPFLYVTLPDGVLAAAAAVAIDARPATRGLGGSALWLAIFTGLLAISTVARESHAWFAFADPLGFVPLLSAMSGQLHAAEPAAAASDVAIGVTGAARHVFAFHSIRWPRDVAAGRAAWVAVSVAVVAAFGSLGSLDAPRPKESDARRFRVAAFASALPVPRLVASELRNAVAAMGPRWAAGVVLVAVAALTLPLAGVERFAAPVAWLLVLPVFAFLGESASASTRDIFRVVAVPVREQILARWFAAALVACVPLGAVGSRFGTAGLALVACALAVAAVGLALGAWLRTREAFEVLALLGWYAGPVNRLRRLDPLALVHAPGIACAACLAVAAVSLAAASRLAARE